MKKLILGLALVLVLGVGLFFGLKSYRFFYEPMSEQKASFLVDVAPGSSPQSLVQSFRAQGIEMDPMAFKIWSRFASAGRKLRVGEYQIKTNQSRAQALNSIFSGQQLLHKFIVKEGHNIYDIGKNFNETYTQRSDAEFKKLLKDPKLLERMQVPESVPTQYRSLEGFLFPETYSYSKYDSAKKLVAAMLGEFERRALPLLKSHEAWGNTAEGRFKLLTLASIVEKESGNKEEQPYVASVFWNRIQKKMRLQSDPTTIYALLPNFDGNLRRADLRESTDYNTYTLPGLPVGPISNPGETAIRAVLNPAQTNYIFFVSRGDGTHVFSEDLKTHNENVREFQLKKKAAPTVREEMEKN